MLARVEMVERYGHLRGAHAKTVEECREEERGLYCSQPNSYSLRKTQLGASLIGFSGSL
jgi:hypothetical protein